MYLWIDKVLALVILALLSIFFGILPLKLVRIIHIKRACAYPRPVSRAELFLGCLDCFAGGVLLATALLHLLPEVREKIEEAFDDYKISTTFATSEFIACVGFFIVMVVENFVMTCVHSHSHEDHSSHESRSGTPASDRTVVQEESERKPLKSDTKQYHRSHSGSYGTVVVPGKENPLSASVVTQNDTKVDTNTSTANPQLQSGSNGQGSSNSDNTTDLIDSVIIAGQHHHHHHGTGHDEHHHGHGHAEISDMTLNNIRDILFLSALSVHTVFDGLAIGLQESTVLVWSLFFAVSMHKTVISFSLGLKLAEHQKSTTRIFTFLLVFVGFCSVGIIIGTVLTEVGQSGALSTLVTGILQGLACGVFLYVTFFEVLHKELAEDHNMLKALSVILGYTSITLMRLFIPDAD